MGVSGLRNFIKTHAPNGVKHMKIDYYKDKVVAVDIYNALYRFIRAIRKNRSDIHAQDGRSVAHLQAIKNIVETYMTHKIIPFFIFDGKAPDIKYNTTKARTKKTQKAKHDYKTSTNEESKNRAYSQMFKLTPDIILECQMLLDYIGVPYLKSPEEADSQCAFMSKDCNNKVWGVVSEDTDPLVFGAPYLLVNFKKKSIIEQYSLSDILENLGISYEHFVDVCILSSTDYCPSIKNMNSSTGYNAIVEILKNEHKYEIDTNADIPGMKILRKKLQTTEFLHKIWPNLIKKQTDKYYLEMLVNDSRFNLMFKLVNKIYKENGYKNTEHSKYCIPDNFLWSYILAKQYYINNAKIRTENEDQPLHNFDLLKQPHEDNIYQLLVKWSGFKPGYVNNFIRNVMCCYNEMIGRSFSHNGQWFDSEKSFPHSSVSFKIKQSGENKWGHSLDRPSAYISSQKRAERINKSRKSKISLNRF
jgi:5'-3' exonuclease